MLTEQERKDIAFKKAEEKKRAEAVAQLDSVAAKIADDSNPHAGRITVRDGVTGEIKHVYTPPKKAKPAHMARIIDADEGVGA